MPAAPLQSVQVFLAVAQQRSFTRAAHTLGVTPSAVSQAVRQLEQQLGVALLARTTRSVSLTDAGRALLARAGPAVAEVVAALGRASVGAGQLAGQLRLSVPSVAVPLVVEPVLPRFLALHPGVTVEVTVDDKLIDVVGEGYDAGVRLGDSIQRDMVRVRLTGPHRFVVVGAPGYLARAGRPAQPEALLQHACLNYRSPTTGAPYVWNFERGRRRWRLPVKGPFVTNDLALLVRLAVAGHGLAYAFEPAVAAQLSRGELTEVLAPYPPPTSGFALYFPGGSRLSPVLRAFVEVARSALRGEG